MFLALFLLTSVAIADSDCSPDKVYRFDWNVQNNTDVAFSFAQADAVTGETLIAQRNDVSPNEPFNIKKPFNQGYYLYGKGEFIQQTWRRNIADEVTLGRAGYGHQHNSWMLTMIREGDNKPFTFYTQCDLQCEDIGHKVHISIENHYNKEGLMYLNVYKAIFNTSESGRCTIYFNDNGVRDDPNKS